MTATVDERGRILIPKGMREHFGLHPGTPVVLEETDEGVVIRADSDPVRAFRRLMETVSRIRPDPDAPPLDPLDVKKIWEPRV